MTPKAEPSIGVRGPRPSNQQSDATFPIFMKVAVVFLKQAGVSLAPYAQHALEYRDETWRGLR
ncbi:MAG TPA: hypothetical protein VF294_08560, partial [Polyangiaceae bacterium]